MTFKLLSSDLTLKIRCLSFLKKVNIIFICANCDIVFGKKGESIKPQQRLPGRAGTARLRGQPSPDQIFKMALRVGKAL